MKFTAVEAAAVKWQQRKLSPFSAVWMQPECVALSVVQQIMKQVSRVRILFLLEVEFIRKSRPHWRTGSDVGGQKTKPASYFILLVFRTAQQRPEACNQVLDPRGLSKTRQSPSFFKIWNKHTQMNIIIHLFLCIYLFVCNVVSAKIPPLQINYTCVMQL